MTTFRKEWMSLIPLVHVKRQFQELRHEILNAIEAVISSGKFILGNEVEMFENEVSEYLNTSFSIGVANGTDALILALHALDIGLGDEVITTPFTFFASAEAISRVGATPVFVDIDPQTYNIDYRKIEQKITNKTKAILPVHIFGQSCEMQELKKLAQKYNLYIIEDACQAFGAEKNGEKLGTIGDIGCFSFFPTKNLSTIGDGGLIVTNNESLAKRIKKLRQHGSNKKYHHSEVGYNSRLDEIHGAILRICLKRIDSWNDARYQKAINYDVLSGVNGIHIPFRQEYKAHIFHLYCIEHDEKEELMKFLVRNNISTGSYYPLPLHLQPAFEHLGYRLGDFPISEQKANRLLALPMHQLLTEKEQREVIQVLSLYKKER
ncbi:DegT/DnrJ/EryC1/StrS family aminotransferase [Priestia filamentosa]|uniref:DegT/DnrJ/EryC1/StrS family aminotransferase n=1 Tax=Priestia filamentosa TaxID=1402861 RepID=UPI003978B2F0